MTQDAWMRKCRRVIGRSRRDQPPRVRVTPRQTTASNSHLIHDFVRPPLPMAEPIDTTTSGTTPEKAAYDPKPSLQYASAVGLQAAGIGALVSAVQNALGTHSSGAAGFLTRTGGTIGFFGTCVQDTTEAEDVERLSVRSCYGRDLRVDRIGRGKSSASRRPPEWCCRRLRGGFLGWNPRCVFLWVLDGMTVEVVRASTFTAHGGCLMCCPRHCGRDL